MKTQTKKRLLDALNACKAIETFVADYTFADYEQNLMTQNQPATLLPCTGPILTCGARILELGGRNEMRYL